jgi:hypothetical protein
VFSLFKKGLDHLAVIPDNSFHACNCGALYRRFEVIIAGAQNQDKGDQRNQDHTGKKNSSYC